MKSNWGYVIGIWTGILVMGAACLFVVLRAESGIGEVRDTCTAQIKSLVTAQTKAQRPEKIGNFGPFGFYKDRLTVDVNLAMPDIRFDGALMDRTVFEWGTCAVGSVGPNCIIMLEDLSEKGIEEWSRGMRAAGAK